MTMLGSEASQLGFARRSQIDVGWLYVAIDGNDPAA